MVDRAHDLTDKQIELMQRRMPGLYRSAKKESLAAFMAYLKTIKVRADRLYENITTAQTDEEKRAAKAEYVRYWANTKKDKRFLNAVNTAVNSLFLANQTAADYINTQTTGIYTENYNYIGMNLDNDLSGYKFKPVTEDEVRKYGDVERQDVDAKKDKSWNAKNLMKSIATGFILGYAADKIFKSAVNKTVTKNVESAQRQASDMATSAENVGRIDSMYRAYDEGFNVKKFWVATKDNRTRDTHRIYDGVDPQELDYEYNTGLKVPRDPDCPIMAEVCNCRCRILYQVNGRSRATTMSAREGEVTGSYRDPRSFRGTTSVNVAKMSYGEWMRWRSQ